MNREAEYPEVITTRRARSRSRIAYRALIAVAATLGVAAIVPPIGDAHDSNGWYWTERKADRRVLNSYSDVESCDCVGWGPTKVRGGRVKYSHFSCSMVLTDGTGILPTLEVLGKRKARMLYNDESDIIGGNRG